MPAACSFAWGCFQYFWIGLEQIEVTRHLAQFRTLRAIQLSTWLPIGAMMQPISKTRRMRSQAASKKYGQLHRSTQQYVFSRVEKFLGSVLYRYSKGAGESKRLGPGYS
jgi:hypothetical protein